jgi:Zn-dependent protease with chaperone function
MTESPIPADPRFPGISSKAYEHPADRAATAALASIPMLDTVVRKLIELRYERSYRQIFLASSVRVGPEQLPALHSAYVRAHRSLDMPGDYDVYVQRSPWGNAGAIGASKPIIVFDSTLAGQLDADEQRAVMAHELGHVLSEHVMYRTALSILLAAAGRTVPFPFVLPVRAITAVLLEWARATELSSDRAATLAIGDPRIPCRALMVLAAGLPSAQLSLDAFLAQAMEYESWDDPTDRVRRFFVEVGVTHSFAVRRVSEMMRWVQSGEYDRIRDGDYVTRDQPTDARAEAGEAVDFYVERFRRLFEDAGETVERFGRQVSDWLRRTGGD